MNFLRLFTCLILDEYKKIGSEEEEFEAALAQGGPIPTEGAQAGTTAAPAQGAQLTAPGGQPSTQGTAAAPGQSQTQSQSGVEGQPSGIDFGFMSPQKLAEERFHFLVSQFFFALVWGVGGAVDELTKQKFEEFFRILCEYDSTAQKYPRYFF